MLSYEAAPAFDRALSVHEPDEFPLAWAAVFENQLEPATEKNTDVVSNAWEPLVDRDEYDRSVARIRELIAAGDTYQVNYSFPLTTSFSGDAYAWFRDLCLAQGGAKYSVYLDMGR
jgi:para-aminobenzoate synthetase/4-amino-4-deoxychorismate lyase